jgi:hypothetical protein
MRERAMNGTLKDLPLAGIKAELWAPAAWGDEENGAALAEVEDGLLAFLKLAAGNWLRHRPATRDLTVDIRWDTAEEVIR